MAARRLRSGSCSAGRLAKILRSRNVRCEPRGRGNWGRVAAICLADGEDLGERLVREGWALADPRYDVGYVAAEDVARRESRGLDGLLVEDVNRDGVRS